MVIPKTVPDERVTAGQQTCLQQMIRATERKIAWSLGLFGLKYFLRRVGTISSNFFHEIGET